VSGKVGLVAAPILALAAGFATARWWLPATPEAARADTAARLDQATAQRLVDLSVEASQRIAALEQALQAETAARVKLEQQIDSLSARLAERPARGAAGDTELPAGLPGAAGFADRAARLAEANQNRQERRLNALVQGGFSTQAAQRILQREAELQMEALQQEYQASRNGEAVNWLDARTQLQDKLRADLGAAQYEQYLAATGRPTRVAVDSVLAGSPAQNAGLQPGDQIVSYGGQRVYDIGELNRLTLQGQTGESVVMSVLRNGYETQIVIPRGPIGITSGRFPDGRRP
jgi:C-terminal processing protease CtpA/Prc